MSGIVDLVSLVS